MATATMLQPASSPSLHDLRSAIEQAERLIVRLDRTNIQQFLVQMDQIEQMWTAFDNPSSLSAEEGRWQGLLKRIATNPKLVNVAASQAGGLAKLRSQHPPAMGSWWHVDEQVAGYRSQMWRRLGIAVGVVVLLILAFWVFNYVMPRDTVTARDMSQSRQIEQLAVQQGWQAPRECVLA